MERFVASEEHAGGRMTDFCNHLYYLSLNPAEAADYGNLDVRLRELTGEQEPMACYTIWQRAVAVWCDSSSS